VKKLVEAASNKNLDFRVITPYEGQRSRIETQLKSAGLPYQDRVFNVDSFQGETYSRCMGINLIRYVRK
jgi:superfamily I DNA and/or RNA helicase